MFLVHCISKIFNVSLLNEFVFKGSKSHLVGAEKGEVVPLYRSIGKSMEGAMRLCNIDICQIFDILGLDRKWKRNLSFKQQVDLLSQFMIVTDIEEINYKAAESLPLSSM